MFRIIDFCWYFKKKIELKAKIKKRLAFWANANLKESLSLQF